MTLAAHDIRVRLQQRDVLRGVSAIAKSSEILAVVGPNGAGKSTLLRTLAGLLQADDGVVTLDGRPIGSWNKQEAAKRIAYLPQERAVYWPLPVEAVVALGRLPHLGQFAAMGPRDHEAVAAAMRAADVDGLAKRPVTQLSGGERARVLFARALAQESPILLIDEPTAGLDPAHCLALFDHLARAAAKGCAVVLATHDLSMAARYAHMMLLIKEGAELAYGSSQMVLTPEKLSAAFDANMAVGRLDGVPVVIPGRRLTD